MKWIFIEYVPRTWVVGFYKPDGKLEAVEDYNDKEQAAERVHYLNGGEGTP